MEQKVVFPQASAVIMTALPIESEIVCMHLGNRTDIKHPAGSLYQLGFFKSPLNDVGWAVVVVETGKRNVQAAIETERALQHFKPDVAVFVGCAGARKDCKIGDVVVASRIHDYESGAETKNGFEGDNEGVSIDYTLKHELTSLSRDNQWKNNSIKPRSVPENKWVKLKNESTVIIGPTASGEKTQKNNKASGAINIANAQRDAVALECEGHGFLKAIYANNHIRERGFVVRGISDYGPWEDEKNNKPPKNPQRDNIDQPAAIALAASFAFHYLSLQDPKIKLYDNNAQGTAGIYNAMSGNIKIPDVPIGTKKQQCINLNFDPYVNAGFFAEAIAMRIAGKAPNGIDEILLCEIITLCQKAGHVDRAWRLIFGLLSNSDQIEIPILAHLYLVAIKLLSQSKNLSVRKRIADCYLPVIEWLEVTNDHKKMASVYSRAGVAFAVDNEKEKSRVCFDLALDKAEKHGNQHQVITVKILWAIASALRGVEFIEDPIKTVVDAQFHYLEVNNATDEKLAQAYPMKSAVQCLFAEAAIFMRGRGMSRGNLRLAAAGILRRKAFSNPDAEGFAELLALIQDDETRNRVRFVMDPSEDISGDPTMQPYLEKCMSLSDIFSFSTKHWKQLRTLLASEDNVE